MLRIFERIDDHLGESCLSALDFGCGTGLLCRYLQEQHVGMSVHGIDLSRQMLERARSNCPSGTFHVGDISSARLPAFDAVVSKDVFNHVSDIGATMAAIDRRLNAGGVLVVANRERTGGVKEGILDCLATLGYAVVTEDHTFTPTAQEIEAFLGTLASFTAKHQAIIKQRLEGSGAYYILAGTKGRP